MNAMILAIENEWAYVAGSYGATVAALVALTASTIIRGRRVGRQVPPEDRRWM